jgi:RNA polymerase sigma factor (sigma-70 family)
VLEGLYRELLNFLSQQTGNRENAKDLAQESYARVLALQQGGQVVHDLRALLFKTARNLMVDQHRRAQHRDHEALEEIPEYRHPPAAPHAQPEQQLQARQTVSALIATIEDLPPRCREAFVMSVFDGLTHAEIARRMDVSKSAVEKHLERALVACRRCQDALEGYGPVDGQRNPPRGQ